LFPENCLCPVNWQLKLVARIFLYNLWLCPLSWYRWPQRPLAATNLDFSGPNCTPKSFIFHKLLPHMWTQFFRVQNPSCWEAFQRIKISGALCIFIEAFKISLIGPQGILEWLFHFRDYKMEAKLALTLWGWAAELGLQDSDLRHCPFLLK
jgi:hypothetical protein